METVVPGGSQGTMQGGIRLVAQSPHCSLSQLLSGQEAQDYPLPECLVRVPLHGEHRSDRVVTEPAGTRACLSAPCHELRNPSQCASVHVSVVPPFPRNVMGKARANEAQSPCPCLLDLEGPLPWADDPGVPLYPDPHLLSPQRVGQDRATCLVSSLRPGICGAPLWRQHPGHPAMLLFRGWGPHLGAAESEREKPCVGTWSRALIGSSLNTR